MPLSPPPFDPLAKLDSCDVVWTTPSVDAAGSMPIGNGEVVLNVWVEAKTGDLLFYVARTDALSEISRFLKLGRVRVHLSPSALSGEDFKQHLHLRDGTVEITGGGVSLLVFVDSGANVVHVTGRSKKPVDVSAAVECWRNSPRKLPKEEQGSAWSVHDAPFDLIESADVFMARGLESRSVTWYHRNETTVVPRLWENQSLIGLNGTFDPILYRTFGARMAAPGFVSAEDRTLAAKAVSDFDLTVATASAQTANVEDWTDLVDAEAKKSRNALSRTKAWWHNFWKRSWLSVEGDGGPSITRGYNLQRYVQACQGRGTYPIKFNGGYYTVEPTAMGKPFDADFRNWGDSHWWQNVRHMYHPMLEQGDFEMMEPLFRMYEAVLPLAEARSQAYHGCEGAYFPETMTLFGTYSGGDYGWDRTGHQSKDVLCPWWQYAWNQGPELVDLMLDRWDYTRDERFLKKRVLPMAKAVLKYFDTRFAKDSRGKIILDPTQVVETFWQGVVNDMPSTAGLIGITNRLTSLPPSLVSSEQRAFFAHMKAACPDLPLEVRNGRTQLAPAQKYDRKTSNVENGELYAVWPFRVVSLGQPGLLDAAKTAYANRLNHLDAGWGYDGNVAAILGMAEEAARILRVKCSNSHPAYRWPATWGPNFDWLPDQNHGGNLLNTANLMLLQSDPLDRGGAIRLLPAWPKEWDADFRLYAAGNTTVHCRAKAGKIMELEVDPPSRKKDIVWPAGWARTEAHGSQKR